MPFYPEAGNPFDPIAGYAQMGYFRVMSERDVHPLIREAIDVFDGSQSRLAIAIGSSQSAVSRMLLKQIPVAAESAVAIERATRSHNPSRTVFRWQLRPDLWDRPIPAPALPQEARVG